MRYVVIAMLVLIVASLGSALYYMMRGRDDPKKMARALAGGFVKAGLVAGERIVAADPSRARVSERPPEVTEVSRSAQFP